MKEPVATTICVRCGKKEHHALQHDSGWKYAFTSGANLGIEGQRTGVARYLCPKCAGTEGVGDEEFSSWKY